MTTFRLYLQTYDEELLQRCAGLKFLIRVDRSITNGRTVVPIRSYPKIPWSRFVTADNRSNVSTDGVDLLDKLLRYNHLERLTAAEALAHSFFSTYLFHIPCPQLLIGPHSATLPPLAVLDRPVTIPVRRPFLLHLACLPPSIRVLRCGPARDALQPCRVRERLWLLLCVTQVMLAIPRGAAALLKHAFLSTCLRRQSTSRMGL